MRNLKRALSLTLASVMLLGMMVIGSSAAQGFPDVDDNDNVEAIEVLQAVAVMVGDAETGNFRPDSPVSRAEMAVVMANLLNLDYNYYATSCPFNDVPDWAKGCVGACYANKIVSGRSETVYDPNATVTAVEASSMLMRALGYFQYSNDYADGFELSTVRQGTFIGIYNGVGSSATEPMTRNQVAQMVLNTLQSGVVQPDGNTINLTTPDGSVLTGKVNYVYVTNRSQAYANAISTAQASSMGSTNDSVIVELGEQLYNGDLKLTGEQNTLIPNVTDDFGRPARRWEYKGEEIGTYAKVEQLRGEYTTEVTGKMLYDLLGSGMINDDTYRLYVTIDGNIAGDSRLFNKNALSRTNEKAVGGTGNGVLTQVYVDTNLKIIRIAIINTYLAIANDDYNEKKDQVSLEVYALKQSGDVFYKEKADLENGDDPISTERIAAGEDFAITDVKKDDKFLVTVAEGVIKSMVDPEILSSETITVHKVDKYVVAGQQYDYTTTVQYNAEVLESFSSNDMKDVTYNIVLDPYGYLIGLERNEDPDQYVFLTGIDDAYSHLSQKNVPANVIFLDGDMKTVTVDTKKSKLSYDAQGKVYEEDGTTLDTSDDVFIDIDDASARKPSQANMWCTYSVDSNGVYTLTAVAGVTDGTVKPKVKVAQYAQNASATEINTKNISLSGSVDFNKVHGTDATVYINTTELANVQVDSGAHYYQIIDDVDSVTVGVSNVNLVVDNITAVTENGHTYAAPANEIYTLYKDNGTIIAVVTLNAEDKATTSHYAYINSSKIDRRGVTEDGKYWFEREAIVDGEFVMLREVGSNKASEFLDTDSMTQGKWYEVKYNANDEVRKVLEVAYAANDHTAPNSANDTATTVEVGTGFFAGVNYSLNNGWDKTLILQADFYDEDEDGGPDAAVELKYDTNTLYVGNDKEKGVYVPVDAKVIVFVEDYDDYKVLSGSNMEAALKFLHNKDAFNGYVNAVVDSNGIARVVILDEKTVTQDEDTYTVSFTGDTGNVTIDPEPPFSGIAEGGSVTFTVKAKRGYVLDSVKIGSTPLVAVEGDVYTITNITSNITVIIAASEDPNVLSDAIAVINKDEDEFAVFYKDGTTSPSGASLANLLIEAAEDAGYTNVKATPSGSGKYKITGEKGKIGLEIEYDSADNIESYVGTVDDNEVYVKKSAQVKEMATWGKSSLPEDYLTGKGTLVKLDGTKVTAGSAVDTNYAVVTSDTGTFTANEFVVETGYVKVSGTNLTSNNKAIPMNQEYTVPKAADFSAAKGSGMTYTIGGTAKYIDYSTNDKAAKIPAGEVTGDITLADGYVEVEIALDESLQSAWSIDTDATDTTTYIAVGSTGTVKINLIEKTPTADKATVKNTSTYDAAGAGMTTVTGETFAAGTHSATDGKTVLNITSTFNCDNATGKVTITVKTIVLDT